MTNPISRFNRTWSRYSMLATLLFCSANAGCKTDNPKEEKTEEKSTESECKWDEDDAREDATEIALEEETAGYLCPLDDMDHYAFTISEGQSMLKVDLMLEAIVSSINPTYVIYSSDGEKVIAQPDRTESTKKDEPLSIIHPIEPGDYVIQIHDEGKDATDNHHPYYLTLTGLSDKDDNEPNDSAEEAENLDGAIEGYLSYRGDEDWYKVSATNNAIVEVSLSIPDGIAPAYRIEDDNGNVVITRTNSKGAESVEYLEPLSETGDYYLIVYHEDELSHDPDVSYDLSVSVVSDPDTNEPNDSGREATVLSTGAVACGAEWTTLTGSGYIATSGDADWFKIDLSACDASVIDVEVNFDDPGSLPENFEAAVRLVRPAPGNPCAADQDCHELKQSPCTDNLDCSGIGNNCNENKSICNGASSCLPGGMCGALLIARNSAALQTSDPEYDPGAPATPGSVHVGAPLLGSTSIFVVVEDFKGNAISVKNGYTVTVKLAKDTDPHEPSEIYMNYPMERDEESRLNLGPHQERAITVPVADCTADRSTCCSNPTDWTEGAISYTFDQDWYRYDHPCPEADCMIEIRYEIDGGPTDVLMSIYRGSSVWYDTIVRPGSSDTISDTGNQSALADTCGDDECLYSYRDHSEYYFNVRDTIFVAEDEGAQNDGIWDWNRDQKYRFCIAKYANQCQAPCNNDPEYGCGQPKEACLGGCVSDPKEYTECTCNPIDPCNWQGDGVCDSAACAQVEGVEETFDDSADCN